MNNKTWIKIWFSFLIIIPIIFITNYIVDPFGVFGTKFLEYQFQRNERFLKIQFLEKNHKNYNSYMFGSSRIGTTHPSIIEKYIPNSKFYNFTISSPNLYDHIMHLKYFIKKRYEIKNLYLQIDIDDMSNYGRGNSDYLRKLHPFVENKSLSLFYLQYLSGLFSYNIKGKIGINLHNKGHNEYCLKTGIWTRIDKERQIVEDCKKYVANEPTFHKKNKPFTGINNIKPIIKALRDIKYLCHKNNIQLYIFTTPHNQNMMDTFKQKDYLLFLKHISEITPFYNFSGYNSITTNNCNYYEKSHYRPIIGKLIAARIFNDKSINIPQDFGIYITKENVR